MSILNISTPSWISQQQRTIIPRSALMQRPGQMGSPAPMPMQGAMSQPNMNTQAHDPRDKVPAMLRRGEEVITPEIKDAVGGREGMVEALNSKLKPKGLALKLNRPPVGEETTEQQMAQGTMDVQGYARGTAQLMPQPTYYPGGITTDLNTNNLNQNMPYNQKRVQQQTFSQGTMGICYKGRKGYQVGTMGISRTAIPQSASVPGTTAIPLTSSTAPTSSTFDWTANSTSFSLPGIPKPPAPIPLSNAINTNPTTTATTAAATPATTTNTTGAAPAVSNATQGIGFQVQPITSSAYFKTQEQSAREALQKQGGVAAMQSAENLAQQGIGQQSAASKTAAAEQAAGTQSNIAGMETQLAQTAQAQQQADVQNTINLAMQTGDWGSVNAALTSVGQQPINFTNLENARQQGNLMGVSNDMLSIAQQMSTSNIPGAGALAETLSQQAMTLRTQAYSTVAGVNYDPTTINQAASQLAQGSYASPEAQAITNVVYPVIESFANTDPAASRFYNGMEGTVAGATLLQQAQAGNSNAVSQLGTLTTLAYYMVYAPESLTASDIATLQQYGGYTDYTSTPSAEVGGEIGALPSQGSENLNS